MADVSMVSKIIIKGLSVKIRTYSLSFQKEFFAATSTNFIHARHPAGGGSCRHA